MNELKSKSETFASPTAADKLGSVKHVIFRAESAKKQLIQLKLFLKETFDDYICSEENELSHGSSPPPSLSSSSEDIDCDRLLKLHSTQSPDESIPKSNESTNLGSEEDDNTGSHDPNGETVIRTEDASNLPSNALLSSKSSTSSTRAPESSTNSPPPSSSPSPSSILNSHIDEEKGQNPDVNVNDDLEMNKSVPCIETPKTNSESDVDTAKPMEISQESLIVENVHENYTDTGKSPQTITLDDLPSPQDMKELSKALALPLSGPATPSTSQSDRLISPHQAPLRPLMNAKPALRESWFLSPDLTILVYKKDYQKELSLYQAQFLAGSYFSKYLSSFEGGGQLNGYSLAKTLVILSFNSIAKTKGWENLLRGMLLAFPELNSTNRTVLLTAAAHYVRFSPDRKSATDEVLKSITRLIHHQSIERRTLVYEIIAIISPFIFMADFFLTIFSILKSLYMRPELLTRLGCIQCFAVVISFCAQATPEDWIIEVFKTLSLPNEAQSVEVDKVTATFLVPSAGCFLLMFRKTERFYLRVFDLISKLLPNQSSEKFRYLQVLTRLMPYLFTELTMTMGLNETLTKLRIDFLSMKQLNDHLNYALLILKSFMNSPNWAPSMQARIDIVFKGFLNFFTSWLEDFNIFSLLIAFIKRTRSCLGDPFVDQVIKPFIEGHPLICKVDHPTLIDAIDKLTLKSEFAGILPHMFPTSVWIQRIVQESPKVIQLTFECQELPGPPFSHRMQTEEVGKCLLAAAYLVLKNNFPLLKATLLKFCVLQNPVTVNEVDPNILAPF